MKRATIQFCTYNRAALLERVLEACFDQNVPADSYEIVVVDDGSSDGTPEVLERARSRATCALTVVRQANSGLAAGRNAGIARAAGERIIFIDDDVLPLPNFVEEHLRSHALQPAAIVRGGAIEVEDIEDLPPPVWSIFNYSGNYFWTTNVSVPLTTIRGIGGFNASFAEYGWEDIDVGLRLRAAGVKAVFNRRALVYHVKPAVAGASIAAMVAQARAKARTAATLVALHPGWRAALATGINPPQLGAAALRRRLGFAALLRRRLAGIAPQERLSSRQLRVARALANEAYFAELERVLSARHR